MLPPPDMANSGVPSFWIQCPRGISSAWKERSRASSGPVVLAQLPQGFLIDGLAALSDVLECIFGYRSEENVCKTENPEDDQEREIRNAPQLTLLNESK